MRLLVSLETLVANSFSSKLMSEPARDSHFRVAHGGRDDFQTVPETVVAMSGSSYDHLRLAG